MTAIVGEYRPELPGNYAGHISGTDGGGIRVLEHLFQMDAANDVFYDAVAALVA